MKNRNLQLKRKTTIKKRTLATKLGPRKTKRTIAVIKH